MGEPVPSQRKREPRYRRAFLSNITTTRAGLTPSSADSKVVCAALPGERERELPIAQVKLVSIDSMCLAPSTFPPSLPSNLIERSITIPKLNRKSRLLLPRYSRIDYDMPPNLVSIPIPGHTHLTGVFLHSKQWTSQHIYAYKRM